MLYTKNKDVYNRYGTYQMEPTTENRVRTKQKKDSIEKANQEAMKIFVKEGADAAAKHMLEKVNGNYNMLRSFYG